MFTTRMALLIGRLSAARLFLFCPSHKNDTVIVTSHTFRWRDQLATPDIEKRRSRYPRNTRQRFEERGATSARASGGQLREAYTVTR